MANPRKRKQKIRLTHEANMEQKLSETLKKENVALKAKYDFIFAKLGDVEGVRNELQSQLEQKDKQIEKLTLENEDLSKKLEVASKKTKTTKKTTKKKKSEE